MKFQINGRVCLAGAVIFGAMTVIVIKAVHPFVSEMTARIPFPWLAAIDAVLIVGGAADTVVTVVRLKSFNRRLKEIDAKVREILDEGRKEWHRRVEQAAEERRGTVDRIREAYNARRSEWQKVLDYQQNLKKKFPAYRSVLWHDAFEQLRRSVKEK